MDDIWKTMGKRAFGGGSVKRLAASATGVDPAPKKPAVPDPTGLSQGQTALAASPLPVQQTTLPATAEHNPRLPPFFVDPTPEWPSIAAELKKRVDGDFTAIVRGDYIRVQTTTIEHFRAIQRHLNTTAKVPFHTFVVPGPRCLKVVLNGLPPMVTDVTLGDALGELNFAVETITRLGGGPARRRAAAAAGEDPAQKKPLRPARWLVTFVADKINDGARRASDIWRTTELFHVRISVEAYKKPPGPPQCHHCQGFGHGSSSCGRPQKCVRCGEAHNVVHCKRPASEKGTCANCGKGHNANWRGCPAWKAAKTAAANRPTQRPEQLPRRPRQPAAKPSTATQPCPAENDDDESSSTEEEQGFTTTGKRRKRQPRNPANRHQPGAAATQPSQEARPTTQRGAPAHAPRTTPRQRLNWPPKPAEEQPAPTAETAAPETAATNTEKSDIFAALAEIVRQLTALAGLIADLAKSQ